MKDQRTKKYKIGFIGKEANEESDKLFMQPIPVQAAEGNGTDDDSGDPTQTKAGWPSASKTGWLVYLVENKSDTVVSDVVALTCGGTPQGTMYLSTRMPSHGL